MPTERETQADPINAQKPIDDVVVDIISRAVEKDRGFVLGLERQIKDGEKKVAVEVRESLPPVDEYQKPAPYRAHELLDTESLIGFANRYGDKVKSLILVNEDAAVLTLDELVERGARERVVCNFPASQAWIDWSKVVAATAGLTHRQFLTFLRNQQDRLVNPEILVVMQTLNVRATVDIDSTISETDKSFGVTFKSNAGDQVARFPKSFEIAVPVFEADESDNAGEHAKYARATIRLEILLPDEPGELVRFICHCPEWRQLRIARVAAETAFIAEALEGWTVLRGRVNERARELGIPKRP